MIPNKFTVKGKDFSLVELILNLPVEEYAEYVKVRTDEHGNPDIEDWVYNHAMSALEWANKLYEPKDEEV